MNITELITQGEEIYATKYISAPKTTHLGTITLSTEYIRDRDAKIEWEQLCSVFLQKNFPGHSKVSEFEKLCTRVGRENHTANSCRQQIAILKAFAAINPTLQAVDYESKQQISPTYVNSKVFIVHGHDAGLKNEIARFLETLEFEAIILHELPNQGSTIIEKIEINTDVGFGIVLYTPCDIGTVKNKADSLNKRARQNVVFEHGYLIAKLGRNRVCALLSEEEIETPGDISGVIYIMKDDAGAWKIQLIKEMKAAGYDIDANKVL